MYTFSQLLGELETGTRVTISTSGGQTIVGDAILYNEAGIRVDGVDGASYVIPWTSVGVISF